MKKGIIISLVLSLISWVPFVSLCWYIQIKNLPEYKYIATYARGPGLSKENQKILEVVGPKKIENARKAEDYEAVKAIQEYLETLKNVATKPHMETVYLDSNSPYDVSYENIESLGGWGYYILVPCDEFFDKCSAAIIIEEENTVYQTVQYIEDIPVGTSIDTIKNKVLKNLKENFILEDEKQIKEIRFPTNTYIRIDERTRTPLYNYKGTAIIGALGITTTIIGMWMGFGLWILLLKIIYSITYTITQAKETAKNG